MAVLLATLAYNSPTFVLEGIQHFRGNSDKSEYDRHVLFDPGYPLPDEKTNRAIIQEIANQYNLEYVPMVNQGVHQNFQFAMEYMKASKGDYFAPVCPDTRGRNKGWVKAISEVLKADKKCFTCQLNRDIDYRDYGAKTKIVGNHEVLYFPQLVAWSTGMFNCEILNSIGGFKAYNARYGYVEHYLADNLLPKGYHWYMIKNYFDTCAGAPDPLYNQWKQLSAAKQTSLDFKDWIHPINQVRL